MYAFFALQCAVIGRKSKHKTDVTACNMESIFTKIIYEIFWSKETVVWIIKIKCFVPPRILDKHWCIYFCLQIPPRENWFQYVRRVYTTTINCPCIITLVEFINYVFLLCMKLWLSFCFNFSKMIFWPF